MTFCIYKLTGENGLIYYGSTNDLDVRLSRHQSPSNKCTSRKLGKFTYEIVEYGIPYKHIALIREGYYIANFTCVNLANPDPWVYKTSRSDYIINWNIENKEKKKEYNTEWYNKNKGKRIKCECGLLIAKTNPARHRKTKRHLSHINTVIPLV